MNDAAMQALGSYKGGTLLFVYLGTGLGSALVVDHTVVSRPTLSHDSSTNNLIRRYRKSAARSGTV